MIDINITLLIQLVNFLITIVVLNWLLIAPIRKIMRERKASLDALGGDAASFEQKAADKLAAYEAELAAARAAAAVEREAMRAEGLAREASVLASAYEHAEGLLGQQRKEISEQTATAEDALRAQVSTLAGQLVTRVLG